MDHVTLLLRLLPNTFRAVDVRVTSNFTFMKMSWTMGYYYQTRTKPDALNGRPTTMTSMMVNYSKEDLGVEGAQEEEHRRDRPKRKKTLLHLIDKRKRFKGKIMA
ncbi:hypothetical protein JHK84_045162 [Glycine max]|nr:hypothetical protein JHK84_045162 [Glycine max]